ncbi:hypothetical protein M0812_12585 [Anaeramoeba flamelloides]|uniref:PH domain-containing protein n=1 Tax=Anaeramoeba flamelloides TaxID=1746091 RepID=A0AAV7ZNX7_9EUKA|nr:hypothetical protein M0812_12585 [Anaeramoeba flamelloides]
MDEITKKTKENNKPILNVSNMKRSTSTDEQLNKIQIDDYLDLHFSLSEHLEMFLDLLEQLINLLKKKDQTSLGKMFEKIFKMNKLLKKDSTLADYSIKTFYSNHNLKDEESLFLNKHFESVSKSVFNLLSYSSGYSKGLDHFYVQIETVKEDIELNLLEAAEKISCFIEIVENVELELNNKEEKGEKEENERKKEETEEKEEKDEKEKIGEKVEKEEKKENKEEAEEIISKENMYEKIIKIDTLDPLSTNNFKSVNKSNYNSNNKSHDLEKDNHVIVGQKSQFGDQILNKRRSVSLFSKTRNSNQKPKETQDSSFHEYPVSKQSSNLQSTFSKITDSFHFKTQKKRKTNSNKITNPKYTESSNTTTNTLTRKQTEKKSQALVKQIHYEPIKPLEYRKSFLKVYFHATSFTTLPLNEKDSVTKVIENIKKKKYIKNVQDYVFVEKIGNTERILDPQVKPYFLKEFWDQSEKGFCRFEYKPISEVKAPLDTNQKRLIRVYFTNSGYITLEVQSETTCLDLMKKIEKKFRFKLKIDINKYSLYLKEDQYFCSFSHLSRTNIIPNKNPNNLKISNDNNIDLNSKLTKTQTNEENYANLRLIELDENIIGCINSFELNSKKMIFIFKENHLHSPKRASVYWGNTIISLDKLNQLKKDMKYYKGIKNNKNNDYNLIKSFSSDFHLEKQKGSKEINSNHNLIKKKKRNSFIGGTINQGDENGNGSTSGSDFSGSDQLHIDMDNIKKGDETCSCFVYIEKKWVPKILSLQNNTLYYFDDFKTSQKDYQIISLTNAQLKVPKKKQFQFQFQKRKFILIQTQLNEEYKISFSSNLNFNQWKCKIENNIISLKKQGKQNSQQPNTINNILHKKIGMKKFEMQINTYQNWLNHHLVQNVKFNQYLKKVNDLQTDLQDGVIFLMVLEIIANENIKYNKEPNLLLTKIKNLKILFDNLRSKNIQLGELNEEAIYDGNLHFILNFIWILIYQIENKHINKGELFTWIKTQIYKVSDIAIHDFTSFKNPDLLLLLLHSLKPLDFPYPIQYLKMGTKEKFIIAFDYANKLLSIPKILSINDIILEIVDERSIITWLYFFFNNSVGWENELIN